MNISLPAVQILHYCHQDNCNHAFPEKSGEDKHRSSGSINVGVSVKRNPISRERKVNIRNTRKKKIGHNQEVLPS